MLGLLTWLRAHSWLLQALVFLAYAGLGIWELRRQEKEHDEEVDATIAQFVWREKAIDHAVKQGWPYTDLHYPDSRVEHIQIRRESDC